MFSSSSEVTKINGPKLPHLTSKKLMDAGFKFKYTFEEMFEDAIECCKENGHLRTNEVNKISDN